MTTSFDTDLADMLADMLADSVPIPGNLLLKTPVNGCYNAGWLAPDGKFQYANRGHEAHRSDVAIGYQHYDHGFLRITVTPGAEVGVSRRGHEPTEAQILAVTALIAKSRAKVLYGCNGDLPAEQATPATVAATIASDPHDMG